MQGFKHLRANSKFLAVVANPFSFWVLLFLYLRARRILSAVWATICFRGSQLRSRRSPSCIARFMSRSRFSDTCVTCLHGLKTLQSSFHTLYLIQCCTCFDSMPVIVSFRQARPCQAMPRPSTYHVLGRLSVCADARAAGLRRRRRLRDARPLKGGGGGGGALHASQSSQKKDSGPPHNLLPGCLG